MPNAIISTTRDEEGRYEVKIDNLGGGRAFLSCPDTYQVCVVWLWRSVMKRVRGAERIGSHR